MYGIEDIKQRIVKVFEEKPTIASFATITEDGKPWVRYVSTQINPDDLTLRFSTFTAARKVKHILKNPEVHLTCGSTDLEHPGDYLQIQGIAKYSTDQKEKDALWNEHLAEYFETPTNPNYAVIIVEPYRIELWSFDSMEPLVWEK